MSDRKAAGFGTVVRGGDLGPTGSRATGKLTFVAPRADGEPTPEQIAAVERAGGRIKKAAPKAHAEPAGE